MRRRLLWLALLVVEILGISLVELRAHGLQDAASQHKEIAITFDDLPLHGPRIDLQRLQAMTGKILAGIKRHQIPVVGFVNESLLYIPGETDARIAILKAWSDAGVELGNHTFSHLRFNEVSLAEYEDDFIRGETLSRILMKEKGQKVRYYRHPFLQMGKTPELEKSFERFIGERGYQIAPVTISVSDWTILPAYANARMHGGPEMTKGVSDEYLKFAERRFDFSEKVTTELFGRQIKHILLLHANELNADNLDRLVEMMKKKGYLFITLEEALKDPIYQSPEKYKDSSDWLLSWAFSKGINFEPPNPPDFATIK